MDSSYRPVSLIAGIASTVIGGAIIAMSVNFLTVSAGGILEATSLKIIGWGSGDIVTGINLSVGGMLAIAGVSLLSGRGRAIAVSAGTGVCILSLIGLALYPTVSIASPPPRVLVSLGVIGIITLFTGTSLSGLRVGRDD